MKVVMAVLMRATVFCLGSLRLFGFESGIHHQSVSAVNAINGRHGSFSVAGG